MAFDNFSEYHGFEWAIITLLLVALIATQIRIVIGGAGTEYKELGIVALIAQGAALGLMIHTFLM